MADRPAFQINWNLPPGHISTRCAECAGQGAIPVQRSYADSDGNVGSMTVPQQCTGCKGKGGFRGLQPPA